LGRPVVRATPELFLAAACRIVSQKTPDIEHAARRLVQASGKHGIDLSLVWATVEPLHVKPLRRKVRQAALAVLGKGKTAMMFVSEPPPEGDSDGLTIGNIERAACIRAACDYFGSEVVTSETADEANSARRSPTEGLDIRIAQALPDPAEPWAVEAFQGAGFISAGTLLYLRAGASNFLADAALPTQRSASREGLWEGFALKSHDELVREFGEVATERLFIEALDGSYEDTLDCPELCGMRATADVLQSHRATGQFDGRLWWALLEGEGAVATLMLNPCPEQRTVELVYLGLSPRARGRGLGRRLLVMGLRKACASRGGWDVACAVDERNVPARKLYDVMGFQVFGRRCAMVYLVGSGGGAE